MHFGRLVRVEGAFPQELVLFGCIFTRFVHFAGAFPRVGRSFMKLIKFLQLLKWLQWKLMQLLKFLKFLRLKKLLKLLKFIMMLKLV